VRRGIPAALAVAVAGVAAASGPGGEAGRLDGPALQVLGRSSAGPHAAALPASRCRWGPAGCGARSIWFPAPAVPSAPSRAAASTGRAAGQTPSGTPQPPRPPTFRVEANYVRVDVYPAAGGEIVRDLAREEFEIFEDGVRQEIAAFERVDIALGRGRDTRREPSSAADARAAAAEPRARVFVLFLDTYHTTLGGSHRMRRALAELFGRILGPDDLVGVMTPEMSASDVTLARRTETIEAFLEKSWNWGRRDQAARLDPEEEQYLACFPESGPSKSCVRPDGREVVQPATFYAGVAREMIERRRGKMTIDAMTDLVAWLGGIREERKAVIAVSDGWQLFRPNPALSRLGECDRPPGPSPVGIGPGGRITLDPDRDPLGTTRRACEAARTRLADVDTNQDFLDLLDRANRANVSFYPVDSRGLPVFDTSIADTAVSPSGTPQPLAPPAADQQRLMSRQATLRALAENTDGLAILNSNDIEGGLRRIAADMTSYYLLGYYSTNTALDGRFREIRVRVRRPGVTVRARRGYRAATPAEVETSAAIAARAAPPSGVEVALGRLAAIRPSSRLLAHLAWVGTPSPEAPRSAIVWITAELDAAIVRSAEWSGGGTVAIALTGPDGQRLFEHQASIPAGERSVRVEARGVELRPGDVAARVRVAPAAGGLPFQEVARLAVPDAWPLAGAARLSRRGPASGARFVPTADLRFRRSDRLQVEVPLAGGATPSGARLLDARGTPIPVPLSPTLAAPDPSGVTWAIIETALAPLAAGDYLIEITVRRDEIADSALVAFRVVP
jgi:VWFA-related protein